MQKCAVIVDKSTVPVGTADKVHSVVQTELSKREQLPEFSVVSNPEFLKEGAAVDDFLRPDRVVIGADVERAINLMRTLYAPFQPNQERLIVMDIKSAELTKYTANVMLATRISFMNELALLAEKVGADIEHVCMEWVQTSASGTIVFMPVAAMATPVFQRKCKRCSGLPKNLNQI